MFPRPGAGGDVSVEVLEKSRQWGVYRRQRGAKAIPAIGSVCVCNEKEG